MTHTPTESLERLPSRSRGQISDLPERVGDVFRRFAECAPNSPALLEKEGVWTYSELSARVDQVQAHLVKLGIRAGDRVMIVGENSRAFVAVFLATASLDAWPTLVNPKLSAHELDAVQEHCGARRVLYLTSLSPHASGHARRHNATLAAEEIGLASVAVGHLNRDVNPEPVEPVASDRVAALIYTSGTTGKPKGVMLTNKGLLFVAGASAGIRSLTPSDCLYGVLPLSHAVGLSVVLLGTLLSGASLYLTRRFDPAATLASLQQDDISVMLGVPAMFALLSEFARTKQLEMLRFPALRIISSSGAPLQAELKSEIERLFGLVLHNGYGLTECSPNIAQTRPEAPRTDVSIGQPLPGVEVKLVGADGSETSMGELHVRGPNVMKGYYRAPDETATAIDTEGWFNTGDLAKQDAEGNLFIVGRTKEVIIRFGLNVYPAELEAVLNACPGVARAAVIGRPVEGVAGDEEIVAFVQPAANSEVTIDQLVNYAAKHMAPYKRPSKIVLVAAMPTTPTGKILKRELMRN